MNKSTLFVDDLDTALKPMLEFNELRALLDGLTWAGIGVDIVNTKHEILFQNEVLKARFGDLIGRRCFENYMGLQEPCDSCPMQQAIAENQVKSAELNASDGRSYQLLAIPLANSDGVVDCVIELVQDITERKAVEKELQDKSIALQELLAGVEREKKAISRRVCQNVDKVVLPLLQSLRISLTPDQTHCVDRIETNLKEVISPFIDGLSRRFASLTQTEIRISALIRQGLITKEIARLEGISPKTVKRHRENIRRKLGLANTDTNLATFLQEMPDGDSVPAGLQSACSG